MVSKSRRVGAAVAMISLCLGLAGCLGMNSDEPPTQTNNAPYGPQYRMPTNPSYSGVGAPRGEIQQAAFLGPRARLGTPVSGPAGETMVEQPAIGAPISGGVIMAGGPRLPTEKEMTTHPPHRVAPPDSLWIEMLRMVPRGPYRLEPLEVLGIEITDSSNALNKQDIRGNFTISPDGKINLGYTYGAVRVGGLTVEQAQEAIRTHLSDILKKPMVNVALAQMRSVQIVRGEHLVRPDGTVNLGLYGSVYVAGMTLGQVKAVVEKHLSVYLIDPQVAVDVFAYNSRKIYIIADGGGYGQQVVALPCAGNETVLDAISRVQGLNSVASQKRIWVARPSPVGHPYSTVLPVDWKAIVQAGRTETNYQLLPGDRIYVSANPFITAYNYIDMAVAPFERVFSTLFLGSTAFRSLSGTNTGSSVLIAR